MIESEKSHQNLSDYNQLLFKKRFEINKKLFYFLVKKWAIQVIVFIIMITRCLERINNPMGYTGDKFRYMSIYNWVMNSYIFIGYLIATYIRFYGLLNLGNEVPELTVPMSHVLPPNFF